MDPRTIVKNPEIIKMLSRNEINSILNSGIYIEPTIRDRCEKRLHYLKESKMPYANSQGQNQFQSNRSDRSNQNYSAYSYNYTRPVNNVPSLKTEDFPSFGEKKTESIVTPKEKNKSKPTVTNLSNVASMFWDDSVMNVLPPQLSKPISNKKINPPPKKIDERVSVTKTALSFKNIFSLEGTTTNSVLSSCVSTTNLFTENTIQVDFNEIKNMFELFAIDRIHANYLDLHRKINILKNTYETVKDFFSYEKLCREFVQMKTYVKIYVGLKNISDSMNSVGRVFLSVIKKSGDSIVLGEQLARSNGMFKSAIDSITSLFNIITSQIDQTKQIIHNYRTANPTRLSNSMSEIQLLCTTLNKIISVSDTIKNKNTFLVTFLSDLNSLMRLFASEFDPMINCSYYAEIRSKENGGIIPKGISSFKYHPHAKISLDTYEKEIVDDDYTIDHIQNLFKQKYYSNSTHFVNILYTDESRSESRNLCMYYTIGEKIPFTKGTVNILNRPADAHILGTIIGLDERIESVGKIIIPNTTDPIHKWLKSRVPSDSFTMSVEEYDGLPPRIKKSYKCIDINTNGIYVDTLFDNLVTADSSRLIITPGMIDSFRCIAYDTSSIKN